MLIPIGHENMSARRWPIITLSLIVINVVVFLCTFQAMEEQAPQAGELKAHILLLAAMHPELTLSPDAQQLIDNFQKRQPSLWKQAKDPNRAVADGWDARMRLAEDPKVWQDEMDSLSSEYFQLKDSSIPEQYGFIPAHPKPTSYLTANFLHGGWLHLIGNMWFLWLAGFVLEDTWGRPLYAVFYFIAGAAALQFYALTNAGSTIPTLGASGAVAALMGAFLMRFPKMKIEMMWLFRFRSYRFNAEAYWLLPLWLLMEIFYGSIFGNTSGVAHWAHVGGFVFGALAALAIRYSGLEHKANAAIEDKITWKSDPEISQATDLIAENQPDAAIDVLKNLLAAKPESLDAWLLLQQTYWNKQDLPAYHETTAKLCAMHLKAREPDQAWQDYEHFLNSGGGNMPAATWFDLCRVLENQKNFERALSEYEKLAAAYPSDRQSLMAQMGAGRICAKQLNRPQDALKFYQAASASAVPHLDWEQTIEAGIREAKAAVAPAHA